MLTVRDFNYALVYNGGITHMQIETILTPEQKETALNILEVIMNSNSILLHCHPSPDPDSLGSALATKFALESIGKKVTIISGDSSIPKGFHHFPGAESVLTQNYGQTDLSQFDLFIIQDTGSLEMISRKAPVVFPEHLKTVVIDHHASNQGFAQLNIVATQYPSTTEILFDLFNLWGIQFSHDMAVNLYIGLFTDTGGFRYDRVTKHSFAMASTLIDLAPDMLEAIKIMENSSSEGRINFLGLTLSQKKVFRFDASTGTSADSSTGSSADGADLGSFVISYISHADVTRLGLTPDDWSGSEISYILRSVVGWNVSCLLIEATPGQTKASFRTRDHVRFDVSKVALALGGGGHKAAAGATVLLPAQEAVEKVAETIKQVLG